MHFVELLCGVQTYLLALLGLIVLALFLLDAFWGVLQLVRAVLAPYFLPQEETNIVKKYGSWARKFIAGSRFHSWRGLSLLIKRTAVQPLA